MADIPKDLLDVACNMRELAYAPYSKFHVGAAIRGAKGTVYGGCNVENAAYPVGACAEAGAISAMVSGGERVIAEILIISSGKDMVTPCGACRQRIREFSGPDTIVHMCGADGSGISVKLSELLPHSFGPEFL